MITPDQIIAAVLEMRELQKKFFAGHRDSITLGKAKRAEAKVDDLVANYKKEQTPEAIQQRLEWHG